MNSVMLTTPYHHTVADCLMSAEGGAVFHTRKRRDERRSKDTVSVSQDKTPSERTAIPSLKKQKPKKPRVMGKAATKAKRKEVKRFGNPRR